MMRVKPVIQFKTNHLHDEVLSAEDGRVLPTNPRLTIAEFDSEPGNLLSYLKKELHNINYAVYVIVFAAKTSLSLVLL